MRLLVSIFLFFLGLHAAGQTLANEQFSVVYSSSGIASLKHVHDTYDTDYIGSGKALGDVLIRYREPGETGWKQAQSAHNMRATGQQVSFDIGRTVPTLATLSRASSSVGARALYAL